MMQPAQQHQLVDGHALDQDDYKVVALDDVPQKMPGYLSYGACQYGYNRTAEYGCNSTQDEGTPECIINGYTNNNNSHCNNTNNHNNNNHVPQNHLTRNWNLEFQKTLEMPKGDANQQLARAVALRNLSNDFASVAGAIAKVIIAEKHLPNRRKTIPAAQLGGIAGGEKYVSQGIIFKFAIETGNDLYLCDEYAMKAANAELRSLMSFIACNVSGLCFPLMALIDYLGYRVIATSLLPISQSTIVYGTSNAALTIHDGSRAPEFMQNIKKAAKCLNLKPHTVHSVSVYSAVDMEGHVGTDGRHYIVDTARAYPPSLPTEGLRGAQHLWNFLRPEFVQSYEKPLSSDAFSAFGRHNQHVHNKEVREATEYLLSVVIPSFAAELDRSKDEISSTNLITSMRRKGINVRYLGVLRNYVNLQEVRSVVLVLMVTHVLKNIIRQQLRNFVSTLTENDDVPSCILATPVVAVILRIFTHVIGGGSEADQLWQKDMKVGLLEKFGTGLTTDEMQPHYDLRAEIWGAHLINVFENLQKSTGVRFSRDLNAMLKRGQKLRRVKLEDLLEPGVRVKYMNFVFHDEGESLVRLARTKACSGEADRLLTQAIPTLLEAIKIKPNDLHSTAVLGEALILQAMTTEGISARSLFLASEQKFQECLEIQHNYALANFGLAFAAMQRATHDLAGLHTQKRQLFIKASKYFDRYSQLVPNDAECFYEWGHCLIEKALFYCHANMVDTEFLAPKSSEAARDSPAQPTKSGRPSAALAHDTQVLLSPRSRQNHYIPPPPPLPPKEFWIKRPRGDILRCSLGILDEAIHKMHKALSLKPDHARAALHMARAYFLKGNFLTELMQKSPEEGNSFADDIDVFYTIAEEQFSNLLSQQTELDHYEVYDCWGSLLLFKSNDREAIEMAQEKYLLSLHSKGLRAPLALAADFDVILEMGNLYGLEPDNHDNPHRWTVFVRLPDGNFCVPFIRQVSFILHHTFRPNVITFKKEPYSLMRRGWGTFAIEAQVRFVDCLGIMSPVVIEHTLRLGGIGGHSTLYRIYKQHGQVIVKHI